MLFQNGDYKFDDDGSIKIWHEGQWVAVEHMGHPHMPTRGSDVETWIKSERDTYSDKRAEWKALDELLTSYGKKADEGLMLAQDHTPPERTP